METEKKKEDSAVSEEKNTFHFSYSAEQQKEIEKIREKYIPREESKMDQLRRLDESASRPGTIVSVTAGIVGTLLLGVGMCCTLVWEETLFIPGIIIGILGIAGIVSAPVLYTRITKKRREKLAPEIIRLTDELTKQQ